MRTLLLLALAAIGAGQTAREKEIALGERVARDIRKHTTPGVAEPYVRAVGNRLKQSGSFWQFEVVKDDIGGPTHAPIAIPGAYIFVPEKLILMTGSEAELAGMLAQAMARVLEHAPGTAWVGNLSGGNIGTQGERELQLKADRRAVQIAAAAGFDPAALLAYIKRIQPEKDSKYSSLPPLEERVAAMTEAIAAIPSRDEWVESSAAFVDAQEEVRLSLPKRPLKPPTLFRIR
jgi:predicted Zn-dependent protease